MLYGTSSEALQQATLLVKLKATNLRHTQESPLKTLLPYVLRDPDKREEFMKNCNSTQQNI